MSRHWMEKVLYMTFVARLSCNSFSFFFSSRRRHTRFDCDWSSDVCSSDLDQSMTMDDRGRVTIRHRKDALYILDDGGFAKPRFMACMGAMHWGHIDFLPVVELFQSLLPGTGSATFELIRGLYDDQTAGGPPRPLRYRGIPTYPSPQAFQLFSTYFVPEETGGADPFPLFMDPRRSAEVIWKPRPDLPRRYLDFAQGVCVTVVGGALQKVTKLNDSVPVPYTRPRKDGWAPGGRMVGTTPQ